MGDMRKGSNNSDLPVCIQSSKSNQVVFSDASKVDAEILDGAAVAHMPLFKGVKTFDEYK